MASMLVLFALGVSEKDIVENYLLSAQFVADKYFPVAPFIVTSVGADMRAQQSQVTPIVNAYRANVDMGRTLIRDNILRPSIRNSVIAGIRLGFVNGGMSVETANAMSEAALNGVISPADIETMTTGALAGLPDAVVDETAAELGTLVDMSDADITFSAIMAGEVIKPLLSVEDMFISSLIERLKELHPINGVMGFLKAPMGSEATSGLGLTDAEIARLRALYLE